MPPPKKAPSASPKGTNRSSSLRSSQSPDLRGRRATDDDDTSPSANRFEPVSTTAPAAQFQDADSLLDEAEAKHFTPQADGSKYLSDQLRRDFNKLFPDLLEAGFNKKDLLLVIGIMHLGGTYDLLGDTFPKLLQAGISKDLTAHQITLLKQKTDLLKDLTVDPMEVAQALRPYVQNGKVVQGFSHALNRLFKSYFESIVDDMVNVSALPPLERMNELSLSGLMALLTGRKTLPEDSFAISDEDSFDDWGAEDSSTAVQSLDAHVQQERDATDSGVDYHRKLASITNNSRRTLYFNNDASSAYDAKYLKLFTRFMEKNAGRIQTPFAYILGMGVLNEISRFMVTFLKVVIKEFPFLFVGTLDYLKKAQSGIGAVKKHPNGHALAHEFAAISIGRFNSVYLLPAVVEIFEKVMKGTGVAYSNFGSPIADLYSTIFSTEVALHSQLVTVKETVAALSLTVQGPDGSLHGALNPSEVFQLVGSFMMKMSFVDAVNRAAMQEIFEKIRNSSISTLSSLIDEVERLTQAGRLTPEPSRSVSSSAMVAVTEPQNICFNWQRAQSCYRGAGCPYRHEGGAQQPVRSTAGVQNSQDAKEVKRYMDHFEEMDYVCRLFMGIFKENKFSNYRIGHYFRRVSLDVRGQILQGFAFQRDARNSEKPCHLPLLPQLKDTKKILLLLNAEKMTGNNSLPLLATLDLKCVPFPSNLVALPPPNELLVSQKPAQRGSSGSRSFQGEHGHRGGAKFRPKTGGHSGDHGQGAHGRKGRGHNQGAHGGGQHQSFLGHGQEHQVLVPTPPTAPPPISSSPMANSFSDHGGPMVSAGYFGHGNAQDQQHFQHAQHAAFLAGQRQGHQEAFMHVQRQSPPQQLMLQPQQPQQLQLPQPQQQQPQQPQITQYQNDTVARYADGNAAAEVSGKF